MTQTTSDSILHQTTVPNGIHKPLLNHGAARTGTPVSNGTSHSPPHPSATSATAGHPTPNPRSCVTCRRRKVKCDKQHPCSNCKKAHIDCIFPGPGRAVRRPRRTQDNAELVERLKKLEGVVQSLGGRASLDGLKDGTKVRSTRIGSDDLSSQGSPRQDGERKNSAGDSRGRTDLERPFGQLEIDQGRSSYIEEPLWNTVAKEVENLKAALNLSSDDDAQSEPGSPVSSPAGSTPAQNHQSFIFGFRSDGVDMVSLHPPADQIPVYWDLYKDHVDPIIKVLHIPLFESRMLEAAAHLGNLPRGLECMMFAVYFGVVTSLWPDECLQKLGQDKEKLLEQYRFGCEQAFARANFLQTDEYIVIQAFVTYLMVLRFHICLRRNDDSRIIWTLTGLIIRMAQTLGLHKDGEQHGLSPFRCEMRRRLWWQICILDTRASEDHGCESALTPDTFDTKMPLNVDDDKISQDMTGFPEEQDDCTHMTFGLVRFEIAALLKKLTEDQAAEKDAEGLPTQAAIEEKERWVRETQAKLQDKYLRKGNPNNPINWVVATVIRSIMAKAHLMIYHPFQRRDGGRSLPPGLKDKLFRNSLANVETSLALEEEAKKHRWGWIFRTYTQWHAIAFLLSELRWRVKGELVERAWHAVDEAMKRRFSDLHSPATSSNHDQFRGQMWRPLRKLAAVAKKARARELEKERQDREALGWGPQTHNLDPIDPIMSVDLGVDRLFPNNDVTGLMPEAPFSFDPWGAMAAPITAAPDQYMSPESQSSGADALGAANASMNQKPAMAPDNPYAMTDFADFGQPQPPDWLMNLNGTLNQMNGSDSALDLALGGPGSGISAPTGTIAPTSLMKSSRSPPSVGVRTNSSCTSRESVDWETWDNLVQEFGMEMDPANNGGLPSGKWDPSFGGGQDFGLGGIGSGLGGVEMNTDVSVPIAAGGAENGGAASGFGSGTNGFTQWY